tara:strand:+ start:1530 stop:2378 length:849 start_codon:yes stop_codon:yes gene_type:complete
MAFLPPIDTSVNIPFADTLNGGEGKVNLLGRPSNNQGIDSLVAMIANKGMAYPFKYEIAIRHSVGKFDPTFSALRLAISCESITMPGKNVATQEIKTHGPVDELPYDIAYAGDVEATFKVGGDMFERRFFDTWIDGQIISSKNFSVGYKDSYSTDIEITQTDLENNPIYRVVLEDAWPKTLHPLELGDEKANEISKQTVSFSYRKWRRVDAESAGFLQGILNKLDLRGRLNRKLENLLGGDIPMIPTAVGGQIISLPFGFDPEHLTSSAGDIINQNIGNLLG